MPDELTTADLATMVLLRAELAVEFAEYAEQAWQRARQHVAAAGLDTAFIDEQLDVCRQAQDVLERVLTHDRALVSMTAREGAVH